MKKILIPLLALCMMILGGCGTKSVLDTYNFGHKVVRVGASEIIVASPFDLGKRSSVTANDKGQPMTLYENAAPDYFLSVVAIEGTPTAPLPTVEAYDEESKKYLLQKVDPKGTWTSEMTTIDGTPAVKSAATYMNGTKKAKVTRYTFVNRDVLWSIIYQHGADNAAGEDIAKRVEGQIQISQKEG